MSCEDYGTKGSSTTTGTSHEDVNEMPAERRPLACGETFWRGAKTRQGEGNRGGLGRSEARTHCVREECKVPKVHCSAIKMDEPDEEANNEPFE